MTIRPIDNQFSGMRANPIDLDGASHYPKVWHLPDWKKGDDRQRIAVLREIAMRSGTDPRFATLAVNICKKHNIQPRDYKAQAQAILKWVQHNIYYVNEPSERLQDPAYTLKVGYGDCDDMAILLATLYESIRLEWRYVLSGKVGKKNTRWIEGTPLPKGGVWSHIYLLVGYPPFQPHKWQFAEPTLRHVDLGWDIIQSMNKGERILPEMGSVNVEEKGIVKIVDEETLAKKEKRKKIIAKWREKLDPENLLSDAIILAITGIASAYMANVIKKTFKE
jgi:hypothetical protein